MSYVNVNSIKTRGDENIFSLFFCDSKCERDGEVEKRRKKKSIFPLLHSRAMFCCLLRHFFYFLLVVIFSLFIMGVEKRKIIITIIQPSYETALYFILYFHHYHHLHRTSEETRKRNDNGPLKLEVQVQPSATAKAQHLTGEQIAMPMTTYDPTATFETRNPFIDPSLAAAIYQQQQINLRPSYGVDPNNIFDPNIYNAALLNQQFLPPIDSIGFRQADNNNVSSKHFT